MACPIKGMSTTAGGGALSRAGTPLTGEQIRVIDRFVSGVVSTYGDFLRESVCPRW